MNFSAIKFVEGVSLREKIHVERESLSSLLKYLTQAADGLPKAHRAGIVHRDLNPDNLMISDDGFAKILDFGLAKLVQPQLCSPPNASKAAAALNPPLSTPGMIMGTAGYRSSEQAAGSAVIDARSDIFSFGCILYEAATKQQPFAGKSLIDSRHKIIHDQPPPIKDFNAEISLDLQRIVRRCLAKNAEDRYQTIKDVAIELKELRRAMEDSGGDDSFGSSKTTADARVRPISERANTVINRANASSAKPVAHTTSSAEYLVGEAKKHKIGAGIAAALLVTLAASIGYGIYNLIAANKDASSYLFQTAKFTRLTTIGKASGVAAISPDGKRLAYFYREDDGPWRIAVTSFEGDSPSRTFDIPALPSSSLRWTTDNSALAYVVTQNGVSNIAVQPINGNKPKQLTNFKQERIFSFDYSRDGKQLAVSRGTIDNDVVLISNIK